MDKRKILALILIAVFCVEIAPLFLLNFSSAITSYPTGTSSPTINPFTDTSFAETKPYADRVGRLYPYSSSQSNFDSVSGSLANTYLSDDSYYSFTKSSTTSTSLAIYFLFSLKFDSVYSGFSIQIEYKSSFTRTFTLVAYTVPYSSYVTITSLPPSSSDTIKINSVGNTVASGPVYIGIIASSGSDTGTFSIDQIIVSVTTSDVANWGEDFAHVTDWSGSAIITTDGDVATISPTSSWLSGWTYRKQITISGASGAGTNYAIRVNVYYGSGSDSGNNIYLNSHCKTDFSDVRFTSSDGSTLLSYWRQSYVDSTSAIFWVKVTEDLSTTRNIYIYYGNSGASYTGDASSVFVMFEDFSGSSLPSGWSSWYSEYGSLAVSSSQLQLTGQTASSSTWKVRAVRYSTAINSDGGYAFMFKVDTLVYSAYHCFDFGVTYLPLEKSPQDGRMIYYSVYDNSYRAVSTAKDGVASSYTGITIGTGIYEIKWVTSSVKFVYQDSQIWESTSNIPVSGDTMYIYFSLRVGGSTASQAEKIYVDWAIQRKYVNPEPSVSSTTSEQRNDVYIDSLRQGVSKLIPFFELSIPSVTSYALVKMTTSSEQTIANITSSGTYRYNLYYFFGSGVTVQKITLEGSFQIDYMRFYGIEGYSITVTGGDKNDVAYSSSGELHFSLSSGHKMSLVRDVPDFSLASYPYCRLEYSGSASVYVSAMTSSDTIIETLTFSSSDTLKFSSTNLLQKLNITVASSTPVLDLISFSVQRIDIDVSVTYRDIFLSTSAENYLISVSARWADGVSIPSSKFCFNLIANSSIDEFNASTSILPLLLTNTLGNTTFSIGLQWCNDSRYRYWVLGSNFTFWIVRTQINVDFEYGVEKFSSGNYLVKILQTSQMTWANGTVISDQPYIYGFINSTSKGYKVLGTDGWLSSDMFTFSVSEAQGQYPAFFALVFVKGTVTQTIYNRSINCYVETTGTLQITQYNLYFDSQYINLYITTNLGGARITVDDDMAGNLASNEPEGYLILNRPQEPGTHTLTITVSRTGYTPITIYAKYTNAVGETLSINTFSFDVDVYCSLFLTTNWGNTTVSLTDSVDGLIGSYSEGLIVWVKSATYGLHTITIYVDGGVDSRTYHASYYNVDPGLVIYYLTISESTDSVLINVMTQKGTALVNATDNGVTVLSAHSEGSITIPKSTVLGSHTVVVTVYDSDDYSRYTTATFSYEVSRRLVYFRYASSVDGLTVYDYANFLTYVNGTLIPTDMYYLEDSTFNLTVTDLLGQVLYTNSTQTIPSSGILTIYLPIYNVYFYNPGYDDLYLNLTTSLGYSYPELIRIPPLSVVGPFRVASGNYTYVVYYRTADGSYNEWHSVDFQVSTSGQTVVLQPHKTTADVPPYPRGGLSYAVFYQGLIITTIVIIVVIIGSALYAYHKSGGIEKVEKNVVPSTLVPTQFGGHLRKNSSSLRNELPTKYGGSLRNKKKE